MAKHHFHPKLNKRRLLSHEDYTVYTVNAYAVRDVAQPDEEFGNFATQDEFPDLIPKGEIWISQKLAPREGVFFVANALAKLRRQADGASAEEAEQAGLEVCRVLRENINGVEFRNGKPHKQVPADIYQEQYITLPDPNGPPVDVWVVDGNLVRSYYKSDYTEGGHGHVYPWVPKKEIWIEDGVDRREIRFIVCHEYLERRMMRDEGLDYDTAHEIASKLEFHLRKREGLTPLLASGRRKITKGDLPGLAREDVFEHVLKTYVRK